MAILINLATKLKKTPPSFLLNKTLLPLLHPPDPPPQSSYYLLHSTNYSSPSHMRFFKHFFCTLKLPYQSSDFESKVDQITPNEPTLHGVIQLLRKTKELASEGEAMDFLDESGVQLSESLVFSAMWELRDEWELAFLAFKWGQKGSFCNDGRVWELMVWVLCKHGKFGTAWRIVRDMIRTSKDSRRAMLIMIESYADANNPSKAIRTFQAMEKFRVTQDSKAFYTLLQALCKNGNIEEAEEFMMVNKSFFPLVTESFNIILNGWCNITLDVVEAKRVWREMSNCCITPDATSYTHLISCFSKVGNLIDSLRLYDVMKKKGWVPGLGVYNSLVYVLSRENCLNEALKVLDTIKKAGLEPDSTTFNSMVVPLCEAHKLEEARSVVARMIREKVSPTIGTYHAFVEGESIEGTTELLKQMKEAGCGPNGETFLLILNKLLKLEQPSNAVRMWAEMLKYEVVPDSAHYSSIIRGLAHCHWLAKARKFYDDMIKRGFSDDCNLEKLFEEPIGKEKGTGHAFKRGCLVRKKVQKLVRK